MYELVCMGEGGGGMTCLCTLVYGEVYDLPMHTGVWGGV